MKQATTFVILSAAAVLVACASHLPAPAPATALAAGQQQPAYFHGYRRMIVNGQERYCQLGDIVGSRIKQEICLTRAQVESAQADAQQLLQRIQQANSECPAPPVVLTGDPMGGLNCLL